MIDRMTDERLVTVSEWLETEATYMKCSPALAKELLQALKAECEYAAELQAKIARVDKWADKWAPNDMCMEAITELEMILEAYEKKWSC